MWQCKRHVLKPLQFSTLISQRAPVLKILNLVLPPPRYVAESSVEYDGIVANVLSALSSSIGKEYTPNLYYVKAPISTRVKSISPLKKNADSSPSISTQISTGRLSTRSIVAAPESRSSVSSSVDYSKNNSELSIKFLEPVKVSEERISKISSESSEQKFYNDVVEMNSTEDYSIPITIEEKFSQAWQRVGAMEDTPKVIGKLRDYLNSTKSPAMEELIGGLEQVEAGVSIAADELDKLRKENERLLQQLQKYVQI